MKAIPFPGANTMLVAPDCDDIPAMRTGTHIVSTWEMSAAKGEDDTAVPEAEHQCAVA
jgi:hypothetical protein